MPKLVANVEDSVHDTSCLGFIIAVQSYLETSHWRDDVQLKCFLHNQKFNTVSETRFGKRNSWMVERIKLVVLGSNFPCMV